MIGYVCVGTNDLPRAAKYYDALMLTLGAKRQWETKRGIAWGTAPEAPTLVVIQPYDGKPAAAGNGNMVAFGASSKAAVDAVYKKALELGGKDEGPVGPRGDDFYAGYFRDPEGNKLAVFFAG
jgi:catechol 2,3-dioxygenase-like lactoylglutathione lyase family enzyme